MYVRNAPTICFLLLCWFFFSRVPRQPSYARARGPQISRRGRTRAAHAAQLSRRARDPEWPRVICNAFFIITNYYYYYRYFYCYFRVSSDTVSTRDFAFSIFTFRWESWKKKPIIIIIITFYFRQIVDDDGGHMVRCRVYIRLVEFVLPFSFQAK